jgi:hypothetical protein
MLKPTTKIVVFWHKRQIAKLSCYNKLVDVDSYYRLKPPNKSESDGCSGFIVDETVIKTDSEFIWLWIAVWRTHKKGEILGFCSISICLNNR